MAHSLSPECTPLKKEYDNCFNAWFEGYLEPAVAVPEGERAAHSKRKAEEFQQQCGKIWEGYRGCIHVRFSSIGSVLEAYKLAERAEGKGIGQDVGPGPTRKPVDRAIHVSHQTVSMTASNDKTSLGTGLCFPGCTI